MGKGKSSFSASEFSESSFWEKVETSAKVAGREALRPALQLYYAQTREETPTWAKALVYSALAYFIMPIDAIPDSLPGGYTDDVAFMLYILDLVIKYITVVVKRLATRKLNEWLPLS